MCTVHPFSSVRQPCILLHQEDGPSDEWLVCVLLFFTLIFNVLQSFSASYVVKYCSGPNDQREVFFTRRGLKDKVDANAAELQSLKIASQRFLHRNEPKALAREICVTEQAWHSLNLDFVHSSMEFSHIPTLIPECRTLLTKGIVRPTTRLNGEGGEDLAPITKRGHLPPWRQLRRGQVIHMREHKESPLYLDNTSRFNLRPPELHMFDRLPIYSRFFVTGKVVDYVVNDDLRLCPWISGSSHPVLLRMSHVDDAVEWLEANLEGDDPARAILDEVFRPLAEEKAQRAIDNQPYSEFFSRFVDKDRVKQCVPVRSMVNPNNFPRWLYHLVLSFGRVSSEADLTAHGNLWEVFRAVGLTERSDQATEEEVRRIVRRWAVEELVNLPLTSSRKEAALLVVYRGMRSFLLGRQLEAGDVPAATHREINEQLQEQLATLQQERRNALIDALEAENFEDFPAEGLRLNQAFDDYVPR